MNEIVTTTTRPYLSAKQLTSLAQTEEAVSSDPSIQFFGLEWNWFLSKWKKLGKKMYVYQKNVETNFVNISRVLSIIELINSTSADLTLHSWAVLTDQLSEEKLREQIFVQRKMSYLGKIQKLDKQPSVSKDCIRKSDQCIFQQIRRKSTHISQCLEVLEFGVSQKPFNFPILEQKSEEIVKISIDSSDDESIDTLNINEEPEKAETENLLHIFSNVVSSKFRIRRKSSYSPGCMKSSSPVRRKSTNDGYKLKRKNVLENISMLATGPCGVGLGITHFVK